MSDWRANFERIERRRSRCLLCGEEMDHAGGRPQRHLASVHGEAQEGPQEPLPAPETPSAGQKSASEREALVASLAAFTRDETFPAAARVNAANVLAGIQGYRDEEPEEDEEDAEARVVDRFRKAIAKRDDLDETFRGMVRDPAMRARVRRLCDEAEKQGV